MWLESDKKLKVYSVTCKHFLADSTKDTYIFASKVFDSD